ncbi:MAG TPA: substrate-binding domain-containing protein [Longimicrobiales bacterium]|nr:substrate-binding domain-containing protein [Longimicrobiales bacterium]
MLSRSLPPGTRHAARCPYRAGRALAALLLCAQLTACADADPDARRTVVLAATHTLEDSGLLDSLARAFRAAHPELHLRVTVSGTGEALEHARRGLADVLLTHAPEVEQQALADGIVLDRQELMYNSFVVAGPTADPAGIRGMTDAAAAFDRIADAGARFVSRDDRSGTNLRELRLWADAGVEPPAGGRYIRAGVGMADALRIADERGAYLLTDSATLVMLGDGLSLEPLVSGDARLRNVYSVMRVAAAPDSSAARMLAGWLLGEQARALIGSFGGEESTLFVPVRERAGTPSGTGPPDTRPLQPPR